MFIIKEKDNVEVVLKINSKENKNLESVKSRINDIVDEFNISLFLDIKIDNLVPKDEVKIEYYSRASASEKIGDNYLNFLNKFLEIGYEDGVKTVPME
ncbi:hypothetical protein N5U00_08265 [Aliarcobacter butzleri]|uniref:hypothetical protein n=1 Tax=Aliarcobacter butzleri TaxID=28197 RepID=UPI0021B6D43B|nr:hypothetical protein [Aliarcobacter butzleri]MCT7575322.1 hypothetical protein [Aliarcobacter butzleri]MDN5077597.1 hypothetical protein [Aliarcobacter butzleri]MDN5118855.1 hypothetical protein [Aliarcobacter butzleri]